MSNECVFSIKDGVLHRCTVLPEVKEITVPEGVVSIAAYAFTNAYAVEKITLPSTLIKVSPGAFLTCDAVKVLALPKSLTEIAPGVFSACTSLMRFEYADGKGDYPGFKIVDGVLFDSECKRLIAYPRVGIGSSYTVPEGVESIGNNAFFGAVWLNELNLPSTLKVISDQAFSNAASLRKISLPNGLKTVGGSAFSGCKMLQSLHVPASVESLPGSALTSLPMLEQITVDSDSEHFFADSEGILYTKDKRTLVRYPSAKKSSKVVVDPEVKVIGYGALGSIDRMEELVLPEGLEAIEPLGIYENKGLKFVAIPEKTAKIGGWAFSGCDNLKSVSFGSHLKEIGTSAFRRCAGLLEVVIPRSVTVIGDGAFDECPEIRKITMPKALMKKFKDIFKESVGFKRPTIKFIK